MAGVFDINMDMLDFTKIRICGQAAGASSDTASSRETRTKSDLLLAVRQNTLVAFVQQCRMYNVDALHALSLQLVILLMSKCTDRQQLCAKFLQFSADSGGAVAIDESAATMIDGAESHALQSTSDWVALFGYLEVAHLSESERNALRENPRVAVFVKSTRHIFEEAAEIERFVVPMLCTVLMHIPATSMLERVLLAIGQQHRDIEVQCLRGVNAYVDQCQHMSNDVTIDAISLLVRAVRVRPEFLRDVVAVVDTATKHGELRAEAAKRQFSLRRHVKDQQSATLEHRALLFQDWRHEMKFSVNISLKTQKILYFIRAQEPPLDMSVLKSMFDANMLAKIFAVSLERIDAAAVRDVIRTLRIFQYNITSLIDFRTQCLSGFNATTQAKLTLPVVLQLYVACWQHASIRDECWRAVIEVSSFPIKKRCEEFRRTHAHEQLSVLRTLLHCHAGVSSEPDDLGRVQRRDLDRRPAAHAAEPLPPLRAPEVLDGLRLASAVGGAPENVPK
jgi:hypothetical protein